MAVASGFEGKKLGINDMTALEPFRDDIYTCNRTRCGFCRDGCAAYIADPEESNSSRGKNQVARAVLEGRLKPSWELYDTAMKCTLNGYCESQCALSNVDILQGMRVELFKNGYVTFGTRLLLRSFFPHPWRIRAAARLGAIASRLKFDRLVDHLPASIRKPFHALTTLPPRIKPLRSIRPSKRTIQARIKVGYFVGCANKMFYGDRAKAVIHVLEENDCDVRLLRNEACCGLPHWYNGDTATQLALGRRFIRSVRDLGVDYVVSDAGSCVSALHRLRTALRLYGKPDELSEASATLDRFVELCTFLTEHIQVRRGQAFKDVKVALHETCHLRYGLRKPDVLARLVAGIPGVTVIDAESAALCCGGPEFLMQQPKLAETLLGLKAEGVRGADVPILLSGSGGCTMNLEYGLRRSAVDIVVMHPAELLAASYGYYSSAARAAKLG